MKLFKKSLLLVAALVVSASAHATPITFVASLDPATVPDSSSTLLLASGSLLGLVVLRRWFRRN